MQELEKLLLRARNEYIKSHPSKRDEILEYYSIHQERFLHLLRTLNQDNLDRKSKVKILDVGCYPPILDIALTKLGGEVIGITSTFEPVKYEKIPTVQINVETDRFPYQPNQFDIIIFTEVLEHFYRSPTKVLKEMKRVLKPGGKLIITTPNITRLYNRLKLLFGRTINQDVEYFTKHQTLDQLYYRHNREYSFQEVKQILTNEGFITKKGYLFNSYTPFRERRRRGLAYISRLAYYFITFLRQSWKDTIYIEAKK